jgi:hypothetical protein
MAIFYKHKEVTPYIGDNFISYVYYGTKLIYEAFLSCFDKGFWVNELPWSNTASWKNKN